MIVVDTSALVAVVFGEPEREAFLGLMRRKRRVLVSTPSVVETCLLYTSSAAQADSPTP